MSRSELSGAMSETLRPAGPGGEDLFETLEGADIALGGGRLLNAEYLSRFGGGQLLEGPQRQDLSIQRVEGVERLLQAEEAFGANRRLGGRSVFAQQLGRQGRRTGCRQCSVAQRHLATGVAHLRAEVVPVKP